eukprot:9145189-Alexandrium_andersonii.AAC.1
MSAGRPRPGQPRGYGLLARRSPSPELRQWLPPCGRFASEGLLAPALRISCVFELRAGPPTGGGLALS